MRTRGLLLLVWAACIFVSGHCQRRYGLYSWFTANIYSESWHRNVHGLQPAFTLSQGMGLFMVYSLHLLSVRAWGCSWFTAYIYSQSGHGAVHGLQPTFTLSQGMGMFVVYSLHLLWVQGMGMFVVYSLHVFTLSPRHGDVRGLQPTCIYSQSKAWGCSWFTAYMYLLSVRGMGLSVSSWFTTGLLLTHATKRHIGKQCFSSSYFFFYVKIWQKLVIDGHWTFQENIYKQHTLIKCVLEENVKWKLIPVRNKSGEMLECLKCRWLNLNTITHPRK